jgi:hypothetical protein
MHLDNPVFRDRNLRYGSSELGATRCPGAVSQMTSLGYPGSVAPTPHLTVQSTVVQ